MATSPSRSPAASSGAAPRDVGVVIPAAGSGVRFGARKALLELHGKPLVFHSLRAFARLPEVREIAVALHEADLAGGRERIEAWSEELRREAPGGSLPAIVAVSGGPTRQESVARAFDALPGVRSGDVRWLAVHDAARPLVDPDSLRRFLDALRESGAAVLGHPASDSVKEERGGTILRDLPRGRIWLVQTPQGASVDLYRRARSAAAAAGLDATDEAGLLGAIGAPVRLVPGSRTNLKVTFPEDLPLAEFILGGILGKIPDSGA